MADSTRAACASRAGRFWTASSTPSAPSPTTYIWWSIHPTVRRDSLPTCRCRSSPTPFPAPARWAASTRHSPSPEPTPWSRSPAISPFLHAGLLAKLVAASAGCDGARVVTARGVEPLLACYRQTARGPIEEAIRRRQVQTRGAGSRAPAGYRRSQRHRGVRRGRPPAGQRQYSRRLRTHLGRAWAGQIIAAGALPRAPLAHRCHVQLCRDSSRSFRHSLVAPAQPEERLRPHRPGSAHDSAGGATEPHARRFGHTGRLRAGSAPAEGAACDRAGPRGGCRSSAGCPACGRHANRLPQLLPGPPRVPAGALARRGAARSAGRAGKVIVEHTAINPNKAAHIGHLRNAALGDTLSACFASRGRPVEVQNYIDDTGVQVADVVVGFKQLEGRDLASVRQLADDDAGSTTTAGISTPRVTEWYQGDTSTLAGARGHAARHRARRQRRPRRWARSSPTASCECHLETMARLHVDYDLLTWEGDILRLHFWATAFEQLKAQGAVYLQTEGRLKGCWVMPIEDDAHGASRPKSEAHRRTEPAGRRGRGRRSSCARTAP